MPKSLTLICALLLSGAMAMSQSQPTGSANNSGNTNSNNGGGQTSNPGTGQPGTGNVPCTGAGQGSGAEIYPKPRSAKKRHHHKRQKNQKTGSSSGAAETKGSNPK